MVKFGLLVLFAAGTLSAPYLVLDDHLPGAQLKDTGCSTLRFPGRGVRFMYQYSGETINQVAGSTELTTGMRMNAKVSIAQTSECTFEMDIMKSNLLSKSATDDKFSASENKFQVEMEKNKMYFSLGLNGEISAVHAHKGDPTHVVNLKRGILSALQLQKDSAKETDVNGVCSSELQEQADGTLVKTKDLSACEKRAVNEIGIQSSSMQSESSTLKPLTSTSSCKYTLNGAGKTKSVECEESHLFRPFSAGFESTSGALTTVKQTLNMIGKKPFNGPRPKMFQYTVNSGMLFDHSKQEMSAANSITAQVDEIMARLVDKSAGGVLAAKQNSAHEFTSLVQVLRKMDKKQLEPVWKQYFDCESKKSDACQKGQTDLRDIYRQYLLDAVTYCGTPTCVSMIRNVIIDGDVTGESMNMFLQGIAFVGKTSSKMIGDVLQIVKKQPSRQAFLTLGTLLGRHCKNNPKECHFGKKNPISHAEKYLKNLVSVNCHKQGKPEGLELALMALKAIGNAGRPVKAFEVAFHCGRESKHNNLTVAAFDAMRSMPCAHERSEELLQYVSNENKCPEKRSHAFRALMKCPDDEILHKLVHRLDNEPSNQLKSLIYTTLSNIAESSDPKNAQWKASMQKFLPLKVIDMPLHQFSRNFEKSFLVDTLVNSGVTAEADVIFNPDGYLPKSAFFNLTATVMGVPIHVVEAAVMVEGLETVLEDVFGPDGVLPDTTIFNLFNMTFTKERLDQLAQLRNDRSDAEFAKKERTRRGVEDNLTKMHKKVNMKRDQPSGSLAFKIMGQEVKVFSYDDIYWAIDKIDNMNVITMLLNVAQGGHKTFSKSMMFLELTHQVSTGLGLPLRLKLTGSAVTTLELDGKFDIRNMFWGPQSMQINGYARSAAVVELSGQMGIESQFVSSGMFVNASTFSSQMLKGNIEYKQGKVLKLNIDTPDEPVQVFNFSSTPFMFMNEKQVLIEGASRRVAPDFCLQSLGLSEYIGMDICTTGRAPIAFRDYEAPYFPLSGPANFGMKLVKADKKLTTYQFLVNMVKRGSVTTGVVEMGTPGATYERKIKGNMKYIERDSKRVLTIGTKEKGQGSEVDFSFDIDTRSMGFAARSNAFTKSDVEYKFDLFNETVALGRQYGMRMEAKYDWYTFNSETKMLLKKTGPMFSTSTTYFPSKTVGASIEYNNQDKKLTTKFDTQDIHQELQMQATTMDNGLKLMMTHLPSGAKAFVMGEMKVKGDNNKLILTADVNGQKAESIFSYETTPISKAIAVSMDVAGKKGEMSATLNHADNKELVLDANMNGYKGTSKIGYYTPKNDRFIALTIGDKQITKAGYYETASGHFESTKSLKWEIDALENKMQVYGILESTQDKQVVDIGASFNEYKAGTKFDYMAGHTNTRELCTSVYYKGNDIDLDPFKVCGKFETFNHPQKMIHKRVTFTAELKELQKMFKVQSDYEKHDGHTTLKSFVTFNKNTVWNILDITHGDISNSNLKITFGTGDLAKDAAIIGGRLYTTKAGKDQKVGIEGILKEKTLGLETSYSDDAATKKLTTEILLNKEKLPVTTALSYFSGDVSGTDMTLTIKDWALTYSTSMKLKAPKRHLDFALTVTKGSEQKLKLFKRNIAVWSPKEKSFEQQIGAVVAGKTYQYGYQVEFLDTSAEKLVYTGKFKLNWSTTRYSAVSLTLVKGKKEAEARVEVEYLPTKTMTHSILYEKKKNKVSVQLEFLPKMFVKFSTDIDSKNGFKITSDASMSWEKFEKSIQWLNEYSNTKKNMKISTSIGKNFQLSAVYSKKKTPTIILTALAMGNKVEIVGSYFNKNQKVNLRFLLNNKEKLGVTGSYGKSKGTQQVTLTIQAGQGRKIAFNALHMIKQRKMSLKMFVNKKTIGGITAHNKKGANSYSLKVTSAKDQLFELYSRNDEQNKAFIMKLNGEKKTLFEIVARKDKKDEEYFLKLNLKKFNKMIEFAAKLDADLKSITLSGITKKTTFGTTMRADWINLVASSHIFINNKIMGWEAKVDSTKKNAIFNVTLTPKLSAQIMLEIIQDKIAKMTFQRKFGSEVVDEASTKFELTPELAKLAFKWNKETINAIRKELKAVLDMLTKHSDKLTKKVNAFSNTYLKQYKEYTKDLKMPKLDMLKDVNMPTIKDVKDNGMKLLKTIDNLDKAFDEYDFSKAQSDLGDAARTALTKMTQATQKGLKMAANGVDNAKENLPELINKTREMVNQLKSSLNGNMENMEQNIKLLREMAIKISEIVVKVTKNFTETARPIVDKAIVLIKDFKIRGKTMTEVYAVLLKKGEDYYKIYSKLAMDELEKLKVDGLKYLTTIKEKGTEYLMMIKERETERLMKFEIPYTNKTVEEVVDIVIAKVTELKEMMTREELEIWIEKAKKMITDNKIDGKKIMEYIETLETLIKGLPAKAKLLAQNAVEQAKSYNAKIDEAIAELKSIYDEIVEFAKPLTEHAKLVQKSITRHFGPLSKIAMKQVSKYLSKLNLPELQPTLLKQIEALQEFSLPLVKSTNEMAKTLISKLKTIEISGKEIGNIMDNGINMAKSVLELNIVDYKAMLSDVINQVNGLLSKLEEITAKQMIDKVIQSSKYAQEQGLEAAKRIYGERKVVLMEHVKKATETLKNLKALYVKLDKETVSKFLESSLKDTSDIMLNSVEQLSSLMKQLAELKLDEPVLKALEQANTHLKKYEINEKITDIIDQLKTFNISKTILDIIMKMEKYATDLYETSYVKAMVLLNRAESVLNYIKSIPKKSYDEWFAELKTFTLRNKEEVVKYLTTVYGLTEPKVQEIYTSIIAKAKSYNYIVDAARDAYNSNFIAIAKESYYKNLKHFQKSYQSKVDAAKELYKTKYDDAYTKYVFANKIANILLKKAERVYDDVKEPTIAVMVHYKNVSTALFNKQYEQIYAKVLAVYTKLYEIMQANIMKYKDLVFNMVDQEYTKLLAKYGDKTWEEIAENIYKFSEEQYLVAQKLTLAEYEKLLVLIEKIKVQGENYFNITQNEYKKALKQVQDKYTELKPKVMELYEKYVKLAKENIELVKTTVDAYISMATKEYNKIEEKVLALYEANKLKTLRQVYDELKKIITDFTLAQYKIAEAKTLEKVEELKSLYKEKYTMLETLAKKQYSDMETLAKKYYEKADTALRTIILPELKKEMVSIINQTLRASVELTKVSVEAFTPHYNLARETIKDLSQEVQEKSVLLREQADKLIKLSNEKLVELYEKIVEYLQEQLKNMDLEAYNKTKKMIEDMLELAKLKLEELKNHELVMKYKKLAQQKYTDYEKMANAKLGDYKKMSEEKLSELKKISEEKYEQFKKLYEEKYLVVKNELVNYYESPEFAKVLDTLKKIQTSAQFTLKKFQEKIEPQLVVSKALLNGALVSVPTYWNKFSSEFMDKPEETFWTAINDMVETSNDIIMFAKAIDFEIPSFEDAMTELKTLIDECTDDFAKQSYQEILNKTINAYKDAKIQLLKLKAEALRLRKVIPEVMQAKFEEVKQQTKNTIKMITQETEKYINLGIDMYKQYLAKAEVALQKIFNNLKEAHLWVKQACKNVQKYLGDCPYSAIVRNQIWSEIANEVVNHELVGATADLLDVSLEQLKKLTKNADIKKMIDLVKELYKTNKDLVEAKLEELKETAMQLKGTATKKYNETKVKYEEALKKFVQTYTELTKQGWTNLKDLKTITVSKYETVLADLEKFMAETRVVDVVDFAVKKYKEGKVLAMEKYESALKLKDIYMKQAMEFYSTMQNKAIELYTKYEAQVIEFYKAYTVQVIAYYEEAKNKIMPYYKEYKAKAMKFYKEKIETLLKDLELKYEELKQKVEEKYGELNIKASELKTKADKYFDDFTVSGKKLAKEAQETIEKKWMQSEIRTRLNNLKKMSVRQTIDELKGLPEKTSIAIKKTTEYIKTTGKELYDMVLKELNEKYADLMAQGMKLKAKVIKLSKDKYDEIIVIITPTYKTMKSAADAVTTEIKETAVFVYRYYHVANKLENLSEFWDAKVNVALELMDGEVALAKKYFNDYKTKSLEQIEIYKEQGLELANKYKAMLTKVVKKYNNEAAKKFEDLMKEAKVYKIKAIQLAKDGQEQAQEYLKKAQIGMTKAGHGLLRGVHSSLVYMDNLNMEKVVTDLKQIAQNYKNNINGAYEKLVSYVELLKAKFPNYVSFDENNMELIISIPHGGYLKPTFSQNIRKLNNKIAEMKTRLRKTVKDARKQIIEMKDNGITKLMKLKKDTLEKVESYKKEGMKQMKYYKDEGMKMYNNAYKTGVNELEKYKKEAMDYAEKYNKKVMTEVGRLADLFMKATQEIRKDLSLVYKADAALLKHAYARAQVYYNKWSKQAEKMLAAYNKKYGNKLVNKVKVMSKQMYNKARKTMKAIYENPMEMYEQIMDLLSKYKQMIESESKVAYKKYAPIAKLQARKYYNNLEEIANDLKKKVMEYALPLKMAYNSLNKGKMVTASLKHLRMYRRYQDKASRYISQQATALKNNVCKAEQKLCKLTKLATKINMKVAEKYGQTIMEQLNLGNFHVDRNIRLGKMKMAKAMRVKDMLMEPNTKAVGMIFGRSHVVTFDGKFYDFVDYKNKKCTYLLARDFQDGKFSIKSTKDSVIVDTEDMSIEINEQGETEAKINGKTLKSLPVASKSGSCKRVGEFVKCMFPQAGLKVVVDVKHFVTVISLSGWHHAKTQGLLGTNNREEFDDWKLPNKKIATNVYALANSYELTQKKCQVRPKRPTGLPTNCNKRKVQQAARRCSEIFKSEDSQFAQIFSKEMKDEFTKACVSDTSNCAEYKRKYDTAHCKTAAAAVLYAKSTTWESVDLPDDCKSINAKNGKKMQTHEVGSTWNQKPLKRSVDVVVIVSERQTVTTEARKTLVKTLENINKRLSSGRYNTRFALVGFGGNDIHERAHLHTLKGAQFSKMNVLSKELTKMTFNGEVDDKNDAYYGILTASTLSFRPGASRVFILYNNVPHEAHEFGPTHTEALRALTHEANAALFVFDSFTFKNLGKSNGKIIGQTNRRMYAGDSTALPLPGIELPASEFKEMVKASQGGMFSNKIKNVKATARAVYEAITFWLNEDSQMCKLCTLQNTWFGVAHPICKADKSIKC